MSVDERRETVECRGCGSRVPRVHKWPPRPECRPDVHEHCDWPGCACWCRYGAGSKAHPEGGHHQWWGSNVPSGAGDGYPPEGPDIGSFVEPSA